MSVNANKFMVLVISMFTLGACEACGAEFTFRFTGEVYNKTDETFRQIPELFGQPVVGEYTFHDSIDESNCCTGPNLFDRTTTFTNLVTDFSINIGPNRWELIDLQGPTSFIRQSSSSYNLHMLRLHRVSGNVQAIDFAEAMLNFSGTLPADPVPDVFRLLKHSPSDFVGLPSNLSRASLPSDIIHFQLTSLTAVPEPAGWGVAFSCIALWGNYLRFRSRRVVS